MTTENPPTAAAVVIGALKAGGFIEVNRRPGGEIYLSDDPIHGGFVIGYLEDDHGGITVWTEGDDEEVSPADVHSPGAVRDWCQD